MASDATISNASKEAVQPVPDKSHERYVQAYEKFLKWQKSQNTNSFDEDVMLAYFTESAKTLVSSTLFSLYSMLRTTIHSNHNVNIAVYGRLIEFLRNTRVGFMSKKSNDFTGEQIKKFLMEAPDAVYLLTKAVTVFGVYGCCRIDEITNVMMNDVNDDGSEIIVRVPDSKTKVTKVCSITGAMAKIVRKYRKLRPPRIASERFFIQYRGGKCLMQVIGKNTISEMPRKIATFLELPDPAGYTGHSIRKIGPTILADEEFDIEAIERHGVPTSTSVAEATLQKHFISSQATCLLCLSTNKKTINFYSNHGRELNIVSILSTHFWFQLEDHTSQNICFECWQNTESFHQFYQSIRTAHKIFETEFVKIDHDKNIADDGKIDQFLQVPPDKFITEFVKIENVEDDELPDANFTSEFVKIDYPVHLSDENFTSEFVKVESDEDIEDDERIGQDDEEIAMSIQVPDEDFNTENMEIENDQDGEDGESSDASVYEITHINPTETRAIMASDLPESIYNATKDALQQFLPDKSQSRYIKAYEKFRQWQASAKTTSFDEDVLLEYFNEMAKNCAPSTLWSVYSMLKTTINCNHIVDISRYSQLLAFLRNKNNGFVPKKPNVFSAVEVRQFMLEAPDSEYLPIKAVTAFCICGGCRVIDITNIKMEHVSDNGREIVVRISDTKTKVEKVYTITGVFVDIVRKYMLIRPSQISTDRFFIQMRGGRCHSQHIGKHAIAKMPQLIAEYLKLPDASGYTGDSFRLSSSTIFADAGARIEMLKRHEPRKSESVAEGTIKKFLLQHNSNRQESLGNKRDQPNYCFESYEENPIPNDVSVTPTERNATSEMTSGELEYEVKSKKRRRY